MTWKLVKALHLIVYYIVGVLNGGFVFGSGMDCNVEMNIHRKMRIRKQGKLLCQRALLVFYFKNFNQNKNFHLKNISNLKEA